MTGSAERSILSYDERRYGLGMEHPSRRLGRGAADAVPGERLPIGETYAGATT